MDRRNTLERRYSVNAMDSQGYSSLQPAQPSAVEGMFKKAALLATTAGKFTQRGVNYAGGVISSTVLTAADAVGVKDKVEAAEKMARKVASKGVNDVNKAVNKTRRMANKAINFDDEDFTALNNADYDLLLSAAGAVEKHIHAFGNYSQTFVVPAGSVFVYKARVKKHDIGFSVREIKENDGTPQIIEPLTVHSAEAQIQGRIPSSDRTRNINLFFDNSHSPLQRKTAVFWVAIGENVSLADDQVGAARSKEVAAAEEGPKELY